MLFLFFKSLFYDKSKHSRARVFPSSQYDLSRKDVPLYVLEVIHQLQKNRYAAFIVGGAVRDFLLKRHPKDFDIATNARPEEITALFRRSRLIGRRFRIVHVYVGRECIEVTTFRGGDIGEQLTDSFGRVIEDNCYGFQHEDAVRRDFSVNALYYDPLSEKIFDYVQGLEDLFSAVVRTIGKPRERFREDPVRMLRAVRFSEKLSFSLEPNVLHEIKNNAGLLAHVPVARLFDELVKILVSGHSFSCLMRLREYGMDESISLLNVICSCMNDQFVQNAIKKTDERVLNGQSVSIMFLFSSFFWPFVREKWQSTDYPSYYSLLRASEEVGEMVFQTYSLPKRIVLSAKEIWTMQGRFDCFLTNRAFRFIKHPRFRLSYDFMILRFESGELPASTASWWQKFLAAHSRK